MDFGEAGVCVCQQRGMLEVSVVEVRLTDADSTKTRQHRGKSRHLVAARHIKRGGAHIDLCDFCFFIGVAMNRRR